MNNYVETLYDYDSNTVEVDTCSFTCETVPVEFELIKTSQIPQIIFVKDEQTEIEFNPTISLNKPFSFNLKVNINSCQEDFILKILNKLTNEIIAIYNFNYTGND